MPGNCGAEARFFGIQILPTGFGKSLKLRLVETRTCLCLSGHAFGFNNVGVVH